MAANGGKDKSKQPIIVRKKKGGGGHAHSTAWKIALADFAVAMMAFFLVMWLLGSTTKDQKKGIEEYFKDPLATAEKTEPGRQGLIDLGGGVKGIIAPPTAGPTENKPITEEELDRLAEEQDRNRLDSLKQKIEKLVEESPSMAQFKDQLLIEIIPEGLRIQIVDKENRPSFDSGKPELKGYVRKILEELGKVISQVPNRASINGYTDAIPFNERGYSNWELSTDRANAARRALVQGGMPESQIARVEGFASSVPYDKADPKSPLNRRIAIVLLFKSVEKKILSAEELQKPQAEQDPTQRAQEAKELLKILGE